MSKLLSQKAFELYTVLEFGQRIKFCVRPITYICSPFFQPPSIVLDLRCNNPNYVLRLACNVYDQAKPWLYYVRSRMCIFAATDHIRLKLKHYNTCACVLTCVYFYYPNAVALRPEGSSHRA